MRKSIDKKEICLFCGERKELTTLGACIECLQAGGLTEKDKTRLELIEENIKEVAREE